MRRLAERPPIYGSSLNSCCHGERKLVSSEGAKDLDPRRWRALILVSVAMLLSLSAWMTATSVSGELQAQWGLSSSQVAF